MRTGTLALLICLYLIDLSAQQNIELLSHLNKYSDKKYTDCWGYAAPDGREYAIIGVSDRTSFVDITNPAEPVEAGYITGPQASPYHWRDIKVHDHYAYIVSEGTGSGQGMQIVDLSDLPNSVNLVNTYTAAFTTAHNLFIADGYAYVVGTSAGGMHILDLSDPVNPVQTAYYSASGYIHDVYVWNDTAFVSSRDTYDLVDVSDKANPKLISKSAALPGIYAHSGWLTEDKRYFIAAEEYNARDLIVWDLQDRSSWNLSVGSWQMPGDSRIHNVFVKGNYLHISYYKEGYVVLDITDPADPVKVGQYDTYPSSSGTFDGVWGVYPFLPSGNIIVSDVSTGLYIFDFLLDSPLPVELNSFTASVNNGEVNLTWETASEINNLGFELQRSMDNKTWNTFAFIEGKGNSSIATKYSYVDKNPPAWKTFYRLVQNDYDGAKKIFDVIEVNAAVPESFSLQQNFPNPFNPETAIRYNIPQDSYVSLKILNNLGEEVTTIVDEYQSEGGYEIQFRGNNLPSGLYIALLQAGSQISSIKMILLK